MPDIREKFSSYRASKKALVWSWVAVAALTMIIGFTWGGWVTGGSAADRAETAANDAVASLAADICYNRFMSDPQVATNLKALKDESSYAREGMVEDGGWATLGGREEPVDGAADLCADKLADAELPVAAAGTETPMAEVTAVPKTTMAN
jgi:hypothetical protein